TSGDRLDLHVNQDEPVFVVEVDEILNRVDISKCDRRVPAKPFPIVESVAVVAKNRRAVQKLAHMNQGAGEVCGQHFARLLANLELDGKLVSGSRSGRKPRARNFAAGIGFGGGTDVARSAGDDMVFDLTLPTNPLRLWIDHTLPRPDH